ncbi:MerR family transcriptional regulator [Streptomyces sp. G-G2]|uniref:MerR family transcriptional regulator n=1 Tax=Streptomyces sp. G-G2 TaxID=3046201 RepID=UPI0024BA8BC5|nr:MerR family transcriptional regulator [Streptomyces sp. G-G2]MDJ0381132.1 MerR family transcriptional regulator [Streptomyces sp. G-G2]
MSTGAVARRLGVSPTTLRSWERRYAIGPARREDGRHRRWTPQDIARLELMCHLTSQGVPPAEAARAALRTGPDEGAVPSEPAVAAVPVPPGSAVTGPVAKAPGGRNALPLGEVRPECRGLARAAVRLDAPALEELLEAALAEHGPVIAWEEIIAPTLHAVGRKWASSGERYVEVEHLLSWHISCALRRVRPAAEGAGRAPVLLACVPGEQHSLPMEALCAALGERGLPVRMFGAALPADALHEAVRRTGPRAVVLWSQSRVTADRALVRSVSGIEWGLRGARTHPLMLLAGPGWGAGGACVPGTERLHGLRSAVALIRSLTAAAPAATPADSPARAAYGS